MFNSVIVPKRDGDFNEIDVLTVSPMGIHVIEAKARVGTFYGNSLSKKWMQQLGSHTYETENPILQNLTHINYLVDYLWEQVPKGRLKTTSLLSLTKNVVLFTLWVINDQSDGTFALNMDCCIGMAEKHYARMKYDERKLSMEEVEIIAKIIRKIASYSTAEIRVMMQQRKSRQDNKEFSHPYTCKLLKGQDPEDGGVYLCRDNGYHYFMYDPNDRKFKAYPEVRILEAGTSSNLQALLPKFNAGVL